MTNFRPRVLIQFLRQLSEVIGAGIENPEDLRSSRPPFNVFGGDTRSPRQSILDPQVPNAEEMYAAVNEPTQSGSVCVRITSQTSAVPPHYKTIGIPTSSIEAARDIFYRIYKHDERANRTNGILERLEFHPLSIRYLHPLPGTTNGTPAG